MLKKLPRARWLRRETAWCANSGTKLQYHAKALPSNQSATGKASLKLVFARFLSDFVYAEKWRRKGEQGKRPTGLGHELSTV
ncbi:MAG: hypothetical protein DWI25_07350 [Planctomycetota bacterium]|nr:MAG: hypothetical protein DWI25_07350 [Planctomycetota bacterium]